MKKLSPSERAAFESIARELGIDPTGLRDWKLRRLTSSAFGKTPKELDKLKRKRTETQAARLDTNDDPKFDEHQFAKAKSQGDREAAMEYLDEESLGGARAVDPDEYKSMTVIHTRPRSHKSELWAKDESQVMALLRATFPYAFTENRETVTFASGRQETRVIDDPNDTRSAKQWNRDVDRSNNEFAKAAQWRVVTQRYFGQGWDAASVADELSRSASRDEMVTQSQVEAIARAIKRRRSGRATDGKPLKAGRGGRRPGAGRPKATAIIKPAYSTTQLEGGEAVSPTVTM